VETELGVERGHAEGGVFRDAQKFGYLSHRVGGQVAKLLLDFL
jgi:hypothetical protein